MNVRLHELAELMPGTTTRPESNSPDGVRFIGPSEIKDPTREVWRVGQPIDQRKAVTVRSDDVIVSLSSDSLYPRLVKDDEDGAVLGSRCIAIRLRDTVPAVEPAWLCAALKSANVRSELELASAGSSVARISLDTLRQLQIPVPPPVEQAQVVSRLAAVEEALTSGRKLLQALEQLVQTEIELAMTAAEEV